MSRTILFIGPSGSGKGTQAKLLLEYLEKKGESKNLYFETGTGFRKFIKEDSYTAGLTKDILDEGGLLPEFLPIWLWTEFLIKSYTGKENLILDGFARRASEAPVFISAMKFYKIQNPVLLSLKVSNEWSKQRLLERGRYDDNSHDIDERLAWYTKEVVPAIEKFKEDGFFQIVEINGEQHVEDVHKDIIRELGI